MEDYTDFDQFLRQAFALSEDDLQEVLHASELPSAAPPADVFSFVDHLVHIENAPMTAAPPMPAPCVSAVGPSQAAPLPPDNQPTSPAGKAKPKRVRKPTQAQRDAHKRFRERRKQQMENMSEEVAAKQQLVQQLQEQKQQLSARLRALEMLIYGGDSAIADLSHQLNSLQLQRQAAPAALVAAPTPAQQLPAPVPAAVAAAANTTAGLHLQQLARTVTTGMVMPAAAPQTLLLHAPAAAAGEVPLPPPAAVRAARAAAAGAGAGAGSPLAGGQHGSSNLLWAQQQQQQQQQQGPGSLPGSTSSSSGGSAGHSLPFTSTTPGTSPGTSERSGGSGAPDSLASELEQELLQQACAGQHPAQQQQQQQQLLMAAAGQGSASAAWQVQAPQAHAGGQWVPPAMQPSAAAAAAAAVSALGGGSSGGGHAGALQQLVPLPRPANALNSRHTPVVAAAAANSDRTLQWQVAVMTLRDKYKKYLGQVAPLALQAQLQNPPDPALLDRMRQLRMEAFRQMSGTLLLQRIPAYMMYTLNLETGQLHTQAPAHHWEAVAANIAPRIPADRLRDMLNCHATYSTCMARIKGHRAALLQQLQGVMGATGTSVTRATSRHLVDAEGPYAEAQRLLGHIEANMRREFALEGCLQRVLSSLLDPLGAAEACMHSYPYMPDFHHILTVLKQQQQVVVGEGAAAGAGGGAAAAVAEEGAAAGRVGRTTRRQAAVMAC